MTNIFGTLKTLVATVSYTDDDAVTSSQAIAILTFLLITILVVITVIFEYVKDVLISTSKKQVVITLYGDLAVMGFLMLMAFAIGYGSGLDTISKFLFGERAKDYVEALMWNILQLVAMTMVTKVVQVMLLLHLIHEAQLIYDNLESHSENHEEIKRLLKQINDVADIDFNTWLQDYLTGPCNAWAKYKNIKDNEMILLYRSLRRELIHKRSCFPPFEIARKSKQLPHDFDFAEYQNARLGNFLVSVIRMRWSIWLAFLIYLILFVVILIAEDGNYLIAAILWIAAYVLQLLGIYILKERCKYILEQIVCPADFKCHDDSESEVIFEDWITEVEQSNSASIDYHQHEHIFAGLKKSSVSSKQRVISYMERNIQDQLLADNDKRVDNGGDSTARLGFQRKRSFSLIESNENVIQRYMSLTSTPTDHSGGRVLRALDKKMEMRSDINEKNDDDYKNSTPVFIRRTVSLDETYDENPKREVAFVLRTQAEKDKYLRRKKHFSPMVRLNAELSDKPRYCKLNPERSSYWTKFFYGRTPPNRYEMLFYFNKYGPMLNIYFIAVHLFLQVIYFTVVTCVLIPWMTDEYGIVIGLIYAFFALVPLVFEYIEGFLYDSITLMSLVSVTDHSEEKTLEQEVIRHMKLEKVMRFMMLLTKIHAISHRVKSSHSKSTDKDKLSDVSEESSEGFDEINQQYEGAICEIDRIFDFYDTKKEGEVSLPTLKLILGTLGLSFSDLEWERLFYTIDVDHNGKVSKLELVEWKLGQNYQQQNSLSVEQLAHEIFNSIDRHQTGEIKLSDFADAIYEFNHPPYNAKISDAEIIAIVKDMDENGDGVISFEEFKAIVDEYTRHSHAS